MRIINKIGTKERLFEMFENVNKIKLNEDVNSQTKMVDSNNMIFQKIFNYLKSNPIFDNDQFNVDGNMEVFYSASPSDWEDLPYSPETRYQPEEGGYADNVIGKFDEILIYDQNDNEYTLSDEALEKLNSIVRFDGNALDTLSNKIANEGQSKSFNESNDNPQLGRIEYKYDKKGNFIPQGYEDKKVALRSLEQPVGSGNWKVAVVMLDEFGGISNIIDTKDTWDEAKDALHSSIT